MRGKKERISPVLLGGALGILWGFVSSLIDVLLPSLFLVAGLKVWESPLFLLYSALRWTILFPAPASDTIIVALTRPFLPPFGTAFCLLGFLSFPVAILIGLILGMAGGVFFAFRGRGKEEYQKGEFEKQALPPKKERTKKGRALLILLGGTLGAIWGLISIFMDVLIPWFSPVVGVGMYGGPIYFLYQALRWTIFFPSAIVNALSDLLICSPFCPSDEMISWLGLASFPLATFVGLILGAGAVALFLARKETKEG